MSRRYDGNRPHRPQPKPLDGARMEELALAYVARFATSASKLRTYLQRKLRERGFAGDEDGTAGEGQAAVERIATRFVENGYIDDENFARMRSRSLTHRGYGPRRVDMALREAGIEEPVRRDAMPSQSLRRDAALTMARKRRFGPFAIVGSVGADEGFDALQAQRALREKQLASMVRAGHSFDDARAVLDAPSIEVAERWASDAEEE